MLDPNKQGAPQAALEWLADVSHPEAWASAAPLLSDPGLAVAVEISDLAPPDTAPVLWIAGPRARLRLPLRDLFASRLDDTLIWLIGWLEGRWPRGRLRVRLPMDAEGRARVGLTLRAPMPPPRLLLSQGPLPLPRASVSHFRHFHGATGAQHLVGGGFEATASSITALTASWRLSPGALRGALGAWPMEVPGDLVSALPPQAVVEVHAAYEPTPRPAVRLQLPRPQARRPLVDLSADGTSHAALIPIRAAAPGRR